MNTSKLLSLIFQRITGEMAMKLFLRLSDRKLSRQELIDTANELAVILMSSLNDVYAAEHNGERPIKDVVIK